MMRDASLCIRFCSGWGNRARDWSPEVAAFQSGNERERRAESPARRSRKVGLRPSGTPGAPEYICVLEKLEAK